MYDIEQHIDQLGNTLVFDKVPRRIISLVPSQTEFLYHLGISPIAQTIFCIHPKSAFKSANKIGGTKKLNIDKIISLKPDLIIGNKEENDKNQILELQQHFPLWMSDIYTPEDAYAMMKALGRILDKEPAVNELIRHIKSSYSSILPLSEEPTCLYLIWQKPFMAVGSPSFIHSNLKIIGCRNLAEKLGRYPELSESQIEKLNPNFIFLSSEPFPFKKNHQAAIQAQFPESKVLLVDGEMFSWYGNRMPAATKYFKQLIKKLS